MMMVGLQGNSLPAALLLWRLLLLQRIRLRVAVIRRGLAALLKLLLLVEEACVVVRNGAVLLLLLLLVGCHARQPPTGILNTAAGARHFGAITILLLLWVEVRSRRGRGEHRAQ